MVLKNTTNEMKNAIEAYILDKVNRKILAEVII